MLSHADIAARIPHAGSMCLLHEVRAWDAESITCTAINHCDAAHPLRHDGKLAALCGVEYGAQAMALHGSLIDGKAQKEGYLIAVRQVQCHVPRLDTLAHALEIRAVMLHAGEESSSYRFSLHHDGATVLEGQATVLVKEKGELA